MKLERISFFFSLFLLLPSVKWKWEKFSWTFGGFDTFTQIFSKISIKTRCEILYILNKNMIIFTTTWPVPPKKLNSMLINFPFCQRNTLTGDVAERSRKTVDGVMKNFTHFFFTIMNINFSFSVLMINSVYVFLDTIFFLVGVFIIFIVVIRIFLLLCFTITHNTVSFVIYQTKNVFRKNLSH